MTARAGRQSIQQWASSFSFLSQARVHGLEVLMLQSAKYKRHDSQPRTGAISIARWIC